MIKPDDLHRLTQAQHKSTELTWAYDPNSNRIRQTDNGETTDYTVDELSNQLLASASPTIQQNLEYDANGNTLSDGNHEYGYDARNRLTSLNNGQVTYGINAFGLRVKKTFAASQPRQPTGDRFTDHFEAADNTLVLDRESNTWQQTQVTAGAEAIIENNHSESVQGVGVDSLPFVYNLRHPGQYADEESGLFYNHFRFYSPMIGRYIQPDLIGLLGGLNTYGYANYSPLVFNDRIGLDATRVLGSGNSVTTGQTMRILQFSQSFRQLINPQVTLGIAMMAVPGNCVLGAVPPSFAPGYRGCSYHCNTTVPKQLVTRYIPEEFQCQPTVPCVPGYTYPPSEGGGVDWAICRFS